MPDWLTQQTLSAALATLGTLAVALPKVLQAIRALRSPARKPDPTLRRIDEATTALLWVHADHPQVVSVLRTRSGTPAPSPSSSES